MNDLAIRADGAIRAFYRTFAPLVGGRVVERGGAVACIGVHPSPIVVNTGWRDVPTSDPGRVVQTVDAIYAEAGFHGAILASSRIDADLEAAALDAGWRVVIELPVMVLERSGNQLDRWPVPPGVDVHQGDPATELGAFRSVLLDGFADEDDQDEREMIRASFAAPDPIAGPGAAVFIAEVDDRPVSVAGVWFLGADAGVGWVATMPESRRRGLGALVTARACAHAFAHGAELLALQASPMGRSVYERLGFTTVGLDRVWVAAGE